MVGVGGVAGALGLGVVTVFVVTRWGRVLGVYEAREDAERAAVEGGDAEVVEVDVVSARPQPAWSASASGDIAGRPVNDP